MPGDERGRRRFALAPDEPVASFALISSIMPREAGRHPQTYRTAFTITLVAALVAAIFGAMPIAVLIAAFAIPIVYITYLYDVNLWEDEPLAVTGFAFLLTGVLAAPEVGGVRGDFLVQLAGVAATVAYSGAMSFVVLVAVDGLVGLRVSGATETEGLDIVEHGEAVA